MVVESGFVIRMVAGNIEKGFSSPLRVVFLATRGKIAVAWGALVN